MITKKLKTIEFDWDENKRELEIVQVHEENEKPGAINRMKLNKSQTGALQRFIFSMFQFHTNPKKKKNSSMLESADQFTEMADRFFGGKK